jgi:hypothetical protein
MRAWYGVLKLTGALVLITLMLTPAYSAENVCPANLTVPYGGGVSGSESAMSPADTYTGTLRVYIAEPWSRFQNTNNDAGRPYYHHAMLDWGMTAQTISLSGTDTLEFDVYWDASSNGWSGVLETNIEVVAVVFNSFGVDELSAPDYGEGPFTAYYTDAVATAFPGYSDSNTTELGYTHSVFLEEGTATWCYYCGWAVNALDQIERARNVNFHYVALVDDECSAADQWLGAHYNLLYFPTMFIDGGENGGLVGGWQGMESTIRSYLNTSGNREVTPLYLKVESAWLDPDIVTAHITLAQAGSTPNQAPDEPDAPTGPSEILMDLTYDYSATCTDPDGDAIYLMWDFGGDVSGWQGPYASGEEVTESYAFGSMGEHDVMVKVKDEYDVESGWSPVHSVTAYMCGDCDQSAEVDIDDAVYTLMYIFAGGPAPYPLEAGDADCSGETDIDDAVYDLMYIFSAGSPPCSPCM